MNKRSGFTLLEVLVVVVIAISVTAFAVPAYKKTQEHNNYLAAKGVLLDVGSAVRALRADLANVGVDVTLIPRKKLLPQHYNGNLEEYQNASSYDLSYFLDHIDPETNQPLIYNTTGWFVFLLFAKGYLSPMPLENPVGETYTDGVYKGYYIYICPAGGGGDVGCCQAAPTENTIACIRSAKKNEPCRLSEYSGAYVQKDGTLKEFGKKTELSRDGCK